MNDIRAGRNIARGVHQHKVQAPNSFYKLIIMPMLDSLFEKKIERYSIHYINVAYGQHLNLILPKKDDEPIIFMYTDAKVLNKILTN